MKVFTNVFRHLQGGQHGCVARVVILCNLKFGDTTAQLPFSPLRIALAPKKSTRTPPVACDVHWIRTSLGARWTTAVAG